MRRLICGAVVALACSAGLPVVDATQDPGRQASQPAAGELIDLNVASAAQLETLPGIGERTAERIIEYRQEHDGFKKIEELMNVRGIGERSFLRLRPLVTVGAAKPNVGASS